MLSVAEARETCPHEAYRARFSGIVGAVLGAVSIAWITVYEFPGLVTAGMVGVVLMFLAIAGARGVVRGRRTARALGAGALGTVGALAVPFVVLGWEGQRVAAVMGAIGVVVAAYALVLMFRPATGKYIHLVEIARLAEEGD